VSERTTSAAWVKGIVDSMSAAGLDALALCTEAGIALPALSDTGARCPTESVTRLWELAAARTGDAGIGLRLASTARPSKFEVVGYAMMSSPTLRAGLDRLVRYLRILSDAAEILLADSGATCRLELILFGGRSAVPAQRYEYDLLALLGFCRWIAGRDLRPVQVEFSHSVAGDAQRHREAFQCPVRFATPCNSLVFAADDLAQPLPAANPMLVELHDRFAGEHIKRLEHDRTSVRARELIVRKLPDGEPRREEIAKALCISERTLQRRLLEEGSSFVQLLDDTRRELAERYLGQPSVSLAQATYLLGFSDQGNFTRACKRWLGVTPSQYRQNACLPPRAA
jgi:AraC-like DNA-binding protein